jgi:hypothetical protein
MINIPSAAADPLTGTLIVVWNDQLFGNPDILSIRSTDGGMTWSGPIRINDDAGTAAQFFPWIAFDPHGTAHVCWYDRREDGYDIDVYYARSTDGGATFEENVRVTAAAYTPILPWDTTVAFIGDYNGIAANATTVFPCYQDARREIRTSTSRSAGGSRRPWRRGTGVDTTGTARCLALLSERVTLRAVIGPTASSTSTSQEGRMRAPLAPNGTASWDGRDPGDHPPGRGLLSEG